MQRCACASSMRPGVFLPRSSSFLLPLLNTDLLPSDVTPLSFTAQTVHCMPLRGLLGRYRYIFLFLFPYYIILYARYSLSTYLPHASPLHETSLSFSHLAHPPLPLLSIPFLAAHVLTFLLFGPSDRHQRFHRPPSLAPPLWLAESTMTTTLVFTLLPCVSLSPLIHISSTPCRILSSQPSY
jgi:hypothetical protein